MPLTALAIVAPGDVITSAQQNIVRSNLVVLDARTGGDPGATGKVPISDGAASSAWVSLATAIISYLGFTPVNKAGDTGVGNLSVNDLTAATYNGGSTSTGTPSVKGMIVGTDGIAVNGTGTMSLAHTGTAVSAPNGTISGKGLTAGITGVSAGAGGVATTGPISGASFDGGSTSTGTVAAKGVVIGNDGLVVGTGGASIGSGGVGPLTVAGQVSPGSYGGGSTGAGTPSFKGAIIGNDGLVVGSGGIASTGAISIGGQQVYYPGNPPPVSGGAGVPSGLIAAFETAAAIASGWARYSALDGRIPVGAGTTFSVTFTEATNYGSSWSHTHTDGGHSHGASALGVGGQTGSSPSTPNGRWTAGGGNTLPDNHVHDAGTLDVTGSTDSGTASISSTVWTIPSRAIVWAQKS